MQSLWTRVLINFYWKVLHSHFIVVYAHKQFMYTFICFQMMQVYTHVTFNHSSVLHFGQGSCDQIWWPLSKLLTSGWPLHNLCFSPLHFCRDSSDKIWLPYGTLKQIYLSLTLDDRMYDFWPLQTPWSVSRILLTKYWLTI